MTGSKVSRRGIFCACALGAPRAVAGMVSLAKYVWMKYSVITAKHLDGFAMFDSKADPFNIVQATPFKRDPMKELAAECRKQDMKLGVYYSQVQDWTAPGGITFAP